MLKDVVKVRPADQIEPEQPGMYICESRKSKVESRKSKVESRKLTIIYSRAIMYKKIYGGTLYGYK